MKNKYRIEGDTVFIELGTRSKVRMETAISVADLEKIQAIPIRWYTNASGSLPYVKSVTWIADPSRITVSKYRGVTTWLHNVILPPVGELEVDHIDRDVLNNRRENLRLVTRSFNQLNHVPFGKGYAWVPRKTSGRDGGREGWWFVNLMRNRTRFSKVVDDEEEAKRLVREFRQEQWDKINEFLPLSCPIDNNPDNNLLPLKQEIEVKSKDQWKSVKVTDSDIKGILMLAHEGYTTQRQIAELYGVSQAYVSRILNGKASRVKVRE